MIKEAFIEAADSLFQDFKYNLEILSSIKVLQLSRSTVTQRCEVMAEDLPQQLQRYTARPRVYLTAVRRVYRHQRSSPNVHFYLDGVYRYD